MLDPAERAVVRVAGKETLSELETKGVLDGGGGVEGPSPGSLTAGVQFGIITAGKMMKRH